MEPIFYRWSETRYQYVNLLLFDHYNTKNSPNVETQLFEKLKAFAEQEEHRERIEIEISNLAKKNINLICKLIKSSTHVRKVTLTSIQKYTSYKIDLIII